MNIKDFFTGYETSLSKYKYQGGKHYEQIKDLKYTKIKIDSPSKYLTKDLWIKKSPPFKVKMVDFLDRHPLWYGIPFLIICSCLASLIAGMIIFKGKDISKVKFALFGLFN